MQHWLIDSELDGLPGWQETFPRAMIVGAVSEMRGLNKPRGVIWCRLRTDQLLADVLNGVDF